MLQTATIFCGSHVECITRCLGSAPAPAMVTFLAVCGTEPEDFGNLAKDGWIHVGKTGEAN